MEISSGISFFGTGYTEQASQTRYAKAASRYESEGISAGGDSYSFSAEALRLAGQMTAGKASPAAGGSEQSASGKGGSAGAAEQGGAVWSIPASWLLERAEIVPVLPDVGRRSV